ncbi:MAG: c-type cytochrome biogenesis protein CcmI, partial [Pseudomonadota bacterium]
MILSTVMVAALCGAVLALLWQAARRSAPSTAHDQDLALVRQAKTELDEAIARGDVTPEDARAEQADLRRRALAVAKLDKGQKPLISGAMTPELLFAAGTVVVACAGFLMLAKPPAPPSEDTQGVAAPPRASIPPQGDTDAYLGFGQERFAQGDYRGAFDSYSAAARSAPDQAGPWLAQGEALIAAQRGQVTPAAMLAFAEAEKRSPGNPISQYYVGLERLQQGDAPAAQKIWQDLKARSRTDAPWMATVERGLAEAARQLGEEPGDSGIGLEQIEAMVAGLAARLEDDGDDPQGWLMLARSYVVLGKPEKARYALKRLGALPDVPTEIKAQAEGLTT